MIYLNPIRTKYKKELKTTLLIRINMNYRNKTGKQH